MQGGGLCFKKTKRRSNKKWFDEECNENMDKKIAARIRVLQHGSDENKKQYTEWRIYYKQLCRKKKTELAEVKLSQIDKITNTM